MLIRINTSRLLIMIVNLACRSKMGRQKRRLDGQLRVKICIYPDCIHISDPKSSTLRLSKKPYKCWLNWQQKLDICRTRSAQVVGGGVPYNLQDSTFDLESVFSGISDILVEECKKNNWKLPRLVVETGRWLVARAGVSIYRVGTTKFTSNGKYFVAVDGGMSDNPRPALYESKYTACLVENIDAKVEHRGSIVGKFCESGDQLITEIDLPEMKRGDLIAMPVSGAYQLSMASNYNLSARPAVLWLEEDRVEVLQPRERAEESAWWTGKQEK